MSLIREHIERTNTCHLDDIEHFFTFENTSPCESVVSDDCVDMNNVPIVTNFNLSKNCALSNDLNSIGSGFSSQSTSKSDLIDDLTSNSALGCSKLVEVGTKQIVNIELILIDLADILKQYFRELPECLFTNKLSQTLIDIFTCKSLFYILLFYCFFSLFV